MATKFVVLAALLAALVVSGSCSTYTTVVTTATVDEEGPNPQQFSCPSEMLRFDTQNCLPYLQRRRSGRSSSMEAPFLRSAVANPQREEEAEPELQQCCNALRSVRSECRCDVIKKALREMREEPQREEEALRAKQAAQWLPSQCGFRSPRQCQIRAIFV
ncbi:2S seed storage protein 1 [Andrographis paniculata]|uniref:2S seed storage protein 1 n=1 Tax=Andrographis paniculata TaxID=175694 RepID=UPI0021E9642B|nr:2S seed storage protein 1 [Andrographis paniculata]